MENVVQGPGSREEVKTARLWGEAAVPHAGSRAD